MTEPKRPDGTQGKAGWGKGKEGEVMQGPAATGSNPFLQGVRVYQKQTGTNSKGQPKFSKQVMTFRVISDKHRGKAWMHPGLEGMLFFPEAAKWSEDQWNNRLLPEILESLDMNKNQGGVPS
jgi:hypothetical protein